MQYPSIKSPPLWYGSGFFPKKVIIMHLLCKNAKNTHFLNEISSKTLSLKMVLDLIHVYCSTFSSLALSC